MRVAINWENFKGLVEYAFPKYGDAYIISFDKPDQEEIEGYFSIKKPDILSGFLIFRYSLI